MPIQVLRSSVASTLQGWRGTSVLHQARQPPQLLQLYDMEGSPYCRLVREALTALGLDVQIYPCPAGGKRFRPEAERIGGKQQFPLLVDANTDTVMYESADIIDYLFSTYGHCETPLAYRCRNVSKVGGYAGTIVRGLRGLNYRKAKAPKKPLALWSFESSPYSRLVRERLQARFAWVDKQLEGKNYLLGQFSNLVSLLSRRCRSELDDAAKGFNRVKRLLCRRLRVIRVNGVGVDAGWDVLEELLEGADEALVGQELGKVIPVGLDGVGHLPHKRLKPRLQAGH